MPPDPDAAAFFHEGSVSGFLHEPRSPTAKSLVLTHGAGANCRTPLLVAVAEAFSEAGYRVLRCDLPFRQRRPFGPPFPKSAEEDRAGLKQAISLMRADGCRCVFVGGHSYGGRQASMLAAAEPGVSDGLLLLSYPLHPPNKPAALRTEHFPKIEVPTLFVHGTTDPFASIPELRSAIARIPAPTELSEINGAGHDLKRGAFHPNALVIQPFEELIQARACGS